MDKNNNETNAVNPVSITMGNCPDCGVIPGQMHKKYCDIEACSNCGEQRFSCGCSRRSHDRAFARWTGFFPGALECIGLGYFTDPKPLIGIRPDYNRFYYEGLHKIFFVKPKK